MSGLTREQARQAGWRDMIQGKDRLFYPVGTVFPTAPDVEQPIAVVIEKPVSTPAPKKEPVTVTPLAQTGIKNGSL